jgi:hypothetical protein
MDIIKAFSKRSFIYIIFFFAMLLQIVNWAIYYGLNAMAETLAVRSRSDIGFIEILRLLDRVTMIQDNFRLYFIPISTVVFILFALLLWLSLRKSLTQFMGAPDSSQKKVSGKSKSKPEKDPKEKISGDRRMFLHLLSVFQREGRLVDFFSEDLNNYEDAQIGAAVRTIHESCKKTLNKYLSPKAVIDNNEGDSVTIQPGFDPDAVKLTGNVTGEPPFKGVLRHRGWQTTKKDLPTLSDKGNASIIAPAEVEIT